MDRVRIGDVQFPVLTGKTIPGRAPWLASWLRGIAARIDGLADRLDDRYVSPLSVPTHDDMPTTFTWSSRWTFGGHTERDA